MTKQTKKEPRKRVKSLEELGEAIVLQEIEEVMPVIRKINQPERIRIKIIKGGLKVFR